MTVTAAPLSVKDISGLPNTYKAKSPAEAYSYASQTLNSENGPVASKKLFVDGETGEIVYEYYRARNKAEKVYIIF